MEPSRPLSSCVRTTIVHTFSCPVKRFAAYPLLLGLLAAPGGISCIISEYGLRTGDADAADAPANVQADAGPEAKPEADGTDDSADVLADSSTGIPQDTAPADGHVDDVGQDSSIESGDDGSDTPGPSVDANPSDVPQPEVGSDDGAVFDAGDEDAGPTVTAVEFKTPTRYTSPESITLGPDGNLWFTELTGNNIGRISPSGEIKEYSVPTDTCHPKTIVAGPDGNLWFTEAWAGNIGRITPSAPSGDIREFPVVSDGSYPYGIAAGPDGNLWFTESYAIRCIDTSGVIVAEFPVPNRPLHITKGPDDALWFTEYYESNVGRITTGGEIHEYPISCGADGIAAGADGNIWYVGGSNCSTVGRVSLSENGKDTPFELPTESAGPKWIARTPSGDLWFTEFAVAQVGRITADGQITEYPLSPEVQPGGIVLGPDGNLWFTETNNDKIGRINP
jgi:streptogramin lyase